MNFEVLMGGLIERGGHWREGAYLKHQGKEYKNNLYPFLLFWFLSKMATRDTENETGQETSDSQTRGIKNLQNYDKIDREPSPNRCT